MKKISDIPAETILEFVNKQIPSTPTLTTISYFEQNETLYVTIWYHFEHDKHVYSGKYNPDRILSCEFSNNPNKKGYIVKSIEDHDGCADHYIHSDLSTQFEKFLAKKEAELENQASAETQPE